MVVRKDASARGRVRKDASAQGPTRSSLAPKGLGSEITQSAFQSTGSLGKAMI